MAPTAGHMHTTVMTLGRFERSQHVSRWTWYMRNGNTATDTSTFQPILPGFCVNILKEQSNRIVITTLAYFFFLLRFSVAILAQRVKWEVLHSDAEHCCYPLFLYTHATSTPITRLSLPFEKNRALLLSTQSRSKDLTNSIGSFDCDIFSYGWQQ